MEKTNKDILKGLKVVRRTEIAPIGYLTVHGPDRDDWTDESLKKIPGIKLDIKSISELYDDAKDVLTALASGLSQRTAGKVMLLAWNLLSSSRAETHVYKKEDFFLTASDVTIESLQDTVLFKGSGTFNAGTVSRDDVVRATCFICASLLRLFSKDPKNYLLAYGRHLQKEYFKCYKVDYPLKHYSPDQKCLDDLAQIFNTISLYKGTLGRFLYNFSAMGDDKVMCEMLFQQHLRLTGMHAVGLFIRACSRLPCTAEDLIDACWHNSTKAGLTTIAKILRVYIMEGKIAGSPHTRQTWIYSRLYDPQYFGTVQTKNCKALVCILATINELTGTSGNQNFMDIVQLQSLPEATKDTYRLWAKRIHTYFTAGEDAADHNPFPTGFE